MKYFILFFLMSVYVFGLDTKEANIKAISAYKSKDFKKAYDLFSKLYLSMLSDVNVNFRLGISAYEIGYYEIALASFERVEILDPNNLRNKLEKARTFFMLKMYQDAERTFKEVLVNPNIPKNVRENIELYLSKVTKRQEKSFTYLMAAIDLLYDSNINAGPTDDTYLIGTTRFASPKQKSDIALQMSANLSNIYDIGDYNGFTIRNRLSVYMKKYKTENQYDIEYFAYMPSLVYQFTRYTTELTAGIDTMSLGGESYLQTLSLTLQFEYKHTYTLKSKVYIKHQRKDFQQQAQYDLNANHNEISYGLQNILSPRSYAQLNLTLVKEEKHHGTRVDVDYNEYKINARYVNQFTPHYVVELYGQLRQRNYNDYSRLFNSTRKDESKIISLSLNRKIMESFHAHVKLNYEKVDSSQSVFSYDKNTFLLGVTKTF